MTRLLKPIARPATIALTLLLASCSGIMLSDMVNSRAVRKGVSSVSAVSGGDRKVRLAWTAPPYCAVSAYRVVNETTGEEFSVAGAETSLAVDVPKNNAVYRFAVYATGADGASSGAMTAIGSAYRPPKRVISRSYDEDGATISLIEFEDFAVDPVSGRVTGSSKGTIDSGVWTLTGSTAVSYDGAGNEIENVTYSGLDAAKTVASATKTEYDASNRWVKKLVYAEGYVLSYYDVAERDSGGIIRKKIRYNPDGSVNYSMEYAYNDDGSIRECVSTLAAGAIRKWLYTYSEDGMLTLLLYIRSSTGEGMRFEYGYNSVSGDQESEIEYIVTVAGALVSYCDYLYSY